MKDLLMVTAGVALLVIVVTVVIVGGLTVMALDSLK